MKIKNIITYASASAFALCIASCTRGFIDMNEDPFQGPYVPGTEKPEEPEEPENPDDQSGKYADINMPGSIDQEVLNELHNNVSTLGATFKSFTYQGLVNDYQRTTNLTHDIYAGYFANNNPQFMTSSPNYVYTQGWSAKRWDHFYKDRSSEYKTLVNTFWFVDKERYKNAFYITRIYYAFLASTMTDTYGDMPFGLYVRGETAPEQCPYNTQKEVYDIIFRMLEQAVDSIVPGACDFTFAENEDKCYGGDEMKWLRFANTLRLRLALRISNVDPERAKQEGEAALTNQYGLMQSQDDRMRVMPNFAPVELGGEGASGEENEVVNCSYNYADVVMSKDMELAYKNLSSQLDPRCEISWYRPTPKAALDNGRENLRNDFTGCRIGDNNVTREFNEYSPLRCYTADKKALPDDYWFSYSREYLWLGYAECKFLQAEAALRGWSRAGGSAEDLFKEGIRESFNWYHLSALAETYIASLNIYNGTESNPFASGDKEAQLEQIITQKWLAVFPNGNEGWAEFRRTDYPRLLNHIGNQSPDVPMNKFIKRISYPLEELQYNAGNCPMDVTQGTRLWWDVQDTNNSNGERNNPDNFR